jgi:hypothetical protein
MLRKSMASMEGRETVFGCMKVSTELHVADGGLEVRVPSIGGGGIDDSGGSNVELGRKEDGIDAETIASVKVADEEDELGFVSSDMVLS